MKAIQLRAHGGPEQLVYDEDTPDPRQEAGDAIIRVFACAIAPKELHWSATYSARGGARRLPSVPGHEVAGIVDRVPETPEPLRAVEALEEGPRILKPGDEVYGLGDVWRDGGAAEYMAIRAADLAPKPASLNFVEAASVPLGALTAWQGLRDRAHLTKGQRVLIHNAAGSIGMYAVQLAHWLGAYVIGTGAEENHYVLQSLGADEVVDDRDRFEDKVGKLDVVFDTVGGEVLERSWGVLRPGGVLVTTEGTVSPEKADRYGVNGFEFIAEPSRNALIEISRLIDEGHIRPMIEAVMPLKAAKMAFELGLAEHHRGKIVLEVVLQRAAAAAVPDA